MLYMTVRLCGMQRLPSNEKILAAFDSPGNVGVSRGKGVIRWNMCSRSHRPAVRKKVVVLQQHGECQ